MDAYLAALAITQEMQLVTIDQGFRNYQGSGLHLQLLAAIERDLIPADPILALKTLQKFIETDSNVIANADDSNGVMADAYHRACQLLGVAWSTTAILPHSATTIIPHVG